MQELSKFEAQFASESHRNSRPAPKCITLVRTSSQVPIWWQGTQIATGSTQYIITALRLVLNAQASQYSFEPATAEVIETTVCARPTNSVLTS